jgi:hypothetical protein
MCVYQHEPSLEVESPLWCDCHPLPSSEKENRHIFQPSGSGCIMLVCDGISEDSHQNWKSIPAFGGYEAVNKEVCLNDW